MAIKGGQIIHAGNGVAVIDRIQTAGPGQLNIPTEKIYELGNYNSVATVRDTPDLVFTSESFDVSLEFEALLSGAYTGRTVSDAVTTSADATLTSATAAFVAADVGRQIRIFYNNGTTQVTTILSRTSGVSIELSENATATDTVALPFLYLESMAYRFGLTRQRHPDRHPARRHDLLQPRRLRSSRPPRAPAPRPDHRHRPPGLPGRESDGRRVLSVTVAPSGSPSAPTTPRPTARSPAAPRHHDHLVDAVPDDRHVRIIYSSPDASPTPERAPRHHGQAGRGPRPRHRGLHRRLRPRRRPRLAGQQAGRRSSRSRRLAGHPGQGRGVRQLLRRRPGLRRPEVNGSVDIKPRDPAELPLTCWPRSPGSPTHQGDRHRDAGPAGPGRRHQAPRHPGRGQAAPRPRRTLHRARLLRPGPAEADRHPALRVRRGRPGSPCRRRLR
jgi:hypothetical protein